MVLFKRDNVLPFADFRGLYCPGSLKEALKVEEMWVAFRSAHSSSSGSQSGLSLKGEMSRRLAGIVFLRLGWHLEFGL
jgi:hypothetical protein